MYFSLKARKCFVLLSFFYSIQSAFSLLPAQDKLGFGYSFILADNSLQEYWTNLDARPDETDEFGRATEVPLVTEIHTLRKPKPDFDPILHLFQMEQECAGNIEASNLMCSLEEPASFSAFSGHASPFSRISIQSAIPWDQFPHADSFLINGTEDVTLILGGSFTESKVPEWLAAWNKLVFNFHQPGRGECQFYFQHFENGIIVLGNNSVAVPQKIYLVLIEKSGTSLHSEQPGIETNLLKSLRTSIGVKINLEQPGPCSIQVMDFNERCIRTLEHQTKMPAGSRVAEFWDGCNDSGMTVANGIYYYRILAATESQVVEKKLKMVILR